MRTAKGDPSSKKAMFLKQALESKLDADLSNMLRGQSSSNEASSHRSSYV